MAEVTANFFEELGRRGHEPLLDRFTGTVRFDLRDGQRTSHYLISITKGDINVSNQIVDADCVIGTDQALFDGFTRGEKNLMTAFLRGELKFQGDPQMLMQLKLLFPRPSGSREMSMATSTERRQS